MQLQDVQLRVQTTNHRFPDQALKTRELNDTGTPAENFAAVWMTSD
jgi:hypothetical protein